MNNKLFQKNRIVIIGHRGTPVYKPENTISSFIKALEHGADGIELDVQKTKDNDMIVFHDTVLSDGTSKISMTNKRELKKLFQKTGNKYTALNDIKKILDRIKILNIEIKSDKFLSNGIEELVVNFILENNIIDKTIVSSFHPLILRKIKSINNNIYTGYLYSKQEVPWILKTYFWGNFIKIDTFHPDIEFLNTDMVNWARKRGIHILAFTVNTKEQYERAEAHNVDGIFTDNTKMMVEKEW